jgi:hypothetical protein
MDHWQAKPLHRKAGGNNSGLRNYTPPASCAQLLDADPPKTRTPLEKRRQLCQCHRAGHGFDLCTDRAVHLFHKGAAAQDAFIGHSMLAASAKIVNYLPPSRAAAQTASLQLWTSASRNTFGHVLTITTSRNPRTLAKSTKYVTDSLPRARRAAHESAVAGPGISV